MFHRCLRVLAAAIGLLAIGAIPAPAHTLNISGMRDVFALPVHDYRLGDFHSGREHHGHVHGILYGAIDRSNHLSHEEHLRYCRPKWKLQHNGSAQPKPRELWNGYLHDLRTRDTVCERRGGHYGKLRSRDLDLLYTATAELRDRSAGPFL